MKSELKLYNTLRREKEIFEPIAPPFVGIYICGPTVYGDPHLGHARPGITFDILFRYLTYLGYQVRYVRNITDVGHLENDGDEGEDKISKKARLEKLEPMEIAQYYTDRYHKAMEQLGNLTPSIEPRATGHILEQMELVAELLEKGYAYESNGSVYFDVAKYNSKHEYGILSGRKLEEMMSVTRELDGSSDKKSPYDFALWKKASPEHIMRWKSPWSIGFPGWHLECSAMSVKYLGDRFDIHGGGLDLLFPHHECEIAQNTAAHGHDAAKYWVHNNMITINGRKMGKSLGNFITLEELFEKGHDLLEKNFSPMTVRFFILQAHYRSTLDFSNDALMAAEKGYDRLMKAISDLDRIAPSDTSSVNVSDLENDFTEAMNDDLNTPIALSVLFEWVKKINRLIERKETITPEDLDALRKLFRTISFDILGLQEPAATNQTDVINPLMDLIIDLRKKAKENKDWSTSDYIRDTLQTEGIILKDTKDGTLWELE